jgi:apolipoprotein N-acyltransferase
MAATGWRGAADRLGGLRGWRRVGVLAALGALATLALPPIHAVPLLWVSFCGLVLMLDGARGRRDTFFVGFWFGWAHCATGIYWIANALLIDPEKFGWMIPFAVLGLGAAMAIYIGLATLLACLIAPSGVGRILALAAAWGLLEWLRGWLFTGFPWNLIGTAWMATLPVAQLASVVGAYGLGVFTVAVTAMPAELFRSGRVGPVATAGSLALLGLVALWGWSRIPDAPMPTVPGVRLRLVQAAIDQREKYGQGNRAAEFLTQIKLTRSPGFDEITDVIWPETATPYFIEQDPRALAAVADAAPRNGLVITGAPRGTLPDKKPFQVWNSLEAVDISGNIVATYDKAHLVPFGEYVPFRSILPIGKIVGGPIDFSAGPGPRTIDLPGLPPVSPLICYEGIFPGAVLDPDHRPRWLLNITNDGWFGISAGPYQHFAASRMRAIEEGIPLVRDGNTGITAIVDPYGRITASLALGEQAVLDGALPEPLDGLTPFARWGNRVSLMLIALVAATAFAVGRRTPKN